MAGEATGKCSKIRHIVRLHQMLRRWRARAAAAPPADVPAGCLAVCVESSCRRFVVPAAHLNHPIFRLLLAQAAEEYGFDHSGPLTFPCDEYTFVEILRHVSSSSSAPFRCSGGLRRSRHAESLPLLRGFVEKSVW